MSRKTDSRRSMSDFPVAGHAAGKRAHDKRMEQYHKRVGRLRQERAVWPGAAFIMEALVLLLFLAGSLAILMSIDADADVIGRDSMRKMTAISQSVEFAEELAADPAALVSEGDQTNGNRSIVIRKSDGVATVCDIEIQQLDGGTMYRAEISSWFIFDWDRSGIESAENPAGYNEAMGEIGASIIYSMETSRYISTHERGAGASAGTDNATATDTDSDSSANNTDNVDTTSSIDANSTAFGTEVSTDTEDSDTAADADAADTETGTSVSSSQNSSDDAGNTADAIDGTETTIADANTENNSSSEQETADGMSASAEEEVS